MGIEGRRAYPDSSSTDPAAEIRDAAMILPLSAARCAPGSDDGRAPLLPSCTLICVIFGIVCLLILQSGAGVPGMPEVGSACPVVGLAGLFGPNGSSLIRHWIRRNIEKSDSLDAPKSRAADPPIEVPPRRDPPADDRPNILERLERVPDALRRFDELVSPGGTVTNPPPAEPSADSSVAPATPDGRAASLPAVGLEAEAFPVSSPSKGPDAGMFNAPDDLSMPHPDSLSDDELGQMFGFDDGDLDSSPEFVELILPEEEPAAVTAALPLAREAAEVIDERALELLIDDLGSDDAEVRGRAVGAIAERGADAVEPLVRALALADDGRRWCIAEALAMIGEDAIPALIAALGDVTAQIGAAATLVRIGRPAVPPLIVALASGDGEVQFGARYALREIGDEAVPPLVEALGAPERSIRRSAASILRELGWKAPDDAGAIRYLIADEAWLDVADYGETAIEPLIRILKSPDREVWWNAARTLGEIGGVAVNPLIELLREAGDEIRPLAAMALTEIGSPAVEPLIGLLSVPSLRRTAAAALLKIGEPAAEACIRALDTTDIEVQETLRDVLGALGEPAVPALIQSLTSGRSRIRSQAAEILGRMNWEPWGDAERAWFLIAREEWTELALMGSPAVGPLIRALNGDDDRIRCEAAATLGEIGDPAAVGPLVDALASESIAPAAADALVALGEPAVAPVLELLEGGDQSAWENAVEVLGRLGAATAVPAIVELVRTGEDRLHRKAVDALIGIGAPAVDSLIPLLAEEGEGQAGAAAALTGIGAPALEPLVGALGSENSSIRMGAARVLEQLGWAPEPGTKEEIVSLIALQRWPDVAEIGAPAVEFLVPLLGDLDPAVQAGAMEALAGIGAPAVPPLILQLGRKALRDPAIEALVRIGDAAVEPLILALEKARLRKTVAGVLVRIGRPAAGALVPVLGHPEIGQTAAGILEAIGEEALDALVEALGNDDALIRQRAGDVLTGLGEAVAAPLVGALGHPDDVVRLGAVDVLTRLGNPVVDLLTPALNDERYLVRLGAAEVLGRVGWEPQTESETVSYLIAKEQWASVAGIGPGAVEPLIRTLNDPDSAIQMGAARALGMIGAPAVARLIYELRTEQDGAQRKAVEALKMIGEPAIIPLIDAFQDHDWQIRLGAARALVGIGDPAVEPLVRALRAAPPAIRMGAAATLGKIGNPAAIEPLIDALLHDDQRLGRVVVRALGMMGEPAVRPLLRVLRDGNEAARKGAVAAFVLIGEPAARLLPGALTDEHFRVRAGVADALDCMGWTPTEEETIVYLIAKERWGDLARAGAAAVEPLVRVLGDRDDSIRRRAAMILGEIRDPRAVPGLMNLLHDDYYSVRREAAAALIAIGSPAVEPVISALSDPDGDVRKRAADVLAEIGDTRAIAPLEGLFNDEDWYARKAAEGAVERIRARAGGEPGGR
jgi:HEAT repeat protein